MNSLKNLLKFCFILRVIFNFTFVNAQITTYSGSYNIEKSEVQFNLETTYPRNENFSQLYRWRYTKANFEGFIFEYNNRFYFRENRNYANSKWLLQGKIGYGLIKGRKYNEGEIEIIDATGNVLGYNTNTFEDNSQFVLNYGLAVGYKWVILDRFTLDFHVGYVGYTQPSFSNVPEYIQKARNQEWNNGIGSNADIQWSIGFLIE
jgi:hypothetical protein